MKLLGPAEGMCVALPALTQRTSDEHMGRRQEEQEVIEKLYQNLTLDKYLGV